MFSHPTETLGLETLTLRQNDFGKKTDCFAVYEQYKGGLGGNGSITTSGQLNFC